MKKITDTLLSIAMAGLCFSGIIFLGFSIFTKGSKWTLAAAAACALLFNSFNLMRMQHRTPVQITEQDSADK